MSRRKPHVAAMIRLREDALAKFRTVAGLSTDSALATAMGIDPSTVSRVLNGIQPPNARFITALVAAFNGLTLDDLWEVVTDDNAESEAA